MSAVGSSLFNSNRTNHRVKSQPRAFESVLVGRKRHEVRRDDRAPWYATGDLITLQEWIPPGPDAASPGYTGRTLIMLIGHVTRDFMPTGWCCFDLIPVEEALRVGAAILR